VSGPSRNFERPRGRDFLLGKVRSASNQAFRTDPFLIVSAFRTACYHSQTLPGELSLYMNLLFAIGRERCQHVASTNRESNPNPLSSMKIE
jgi:hypothetical protein